MTTKKLPNNTDWVISSHSLNSERERAIYAMGKEKGVEEAHEKHIDHIGKNLAKSYNDTTKILEKLKANNIDIISARLKMRSENCFKILLSVKDTEDIPLNLDNIYNFIHEVETTSNTNDYMVDFSIVKANSNFSDAKVENDGYIFKHRLFINEEDTRPA
jgi:hypothetical protein